MVWARRSQVPASFGATATIWSSTAMPVRKSFLAKAASASCLSWSTGFEGVPASDLICASSSTALLVRSSLVNGLFAAVAEQQAMAKQAAAAAATRPARKDENIGKSSQERAKADRGGIRPALKFEAKIVSRSWPDRHRRT